MNESIPPIRKKKNRKSISLAVKLQVIGRIQNGERPSAVARNMGLPPSTVRTIHKDASRILECSETASSLSSKVISRKRSKIMERLEFELCQWIQLMSDRAVDVTMLMIQDKALEIFSILQEQEPEDSPDKKERFTASRGWFDRFKKRQNIHLSGNSFEKITIGAARELELQELQEELILSGDSAYDRTSTQTIKEEMDEPVETAQNFLEFQMVVDDNEDDGADDSLHEDEPQKKEICKMKEARTSMLDIQVDQHKLSNPDKRSKVLHEIETIFQEWTLKKKYEDTFGDTHVIIFNNESGSITATLKTYAFGLIAVTFEHTVEEPLMTDPMLEEMRKLINSKLDARSETIPPLKRGSSVPLYFSSADERILEYDFDKIVFEKDSPYQNIKILHSPTLGNCLILDDLQNLADSDINYTHGVMKHGIIPYAGKEVLILGGGDGGLLHELLKENPKFITMVDQMVVDACREHLRGCCGDSLDKLEGPNYKVIIDDCLKKLDEYKNEGRKFDIIINDLTDIPIATAPQGELWDFIKKILVKSFAVLKDDGSYLNHAISEGCVDALKNYENVLSNLPEEVTFEKHMAFVPSFMENWVFYEVKRKL